jgi:hypothetical protein
MEKKLVLKNDQYRKSRGGYARCLKIICKKCSSIICQYQKDGSGPLKRLYVDRILAPKLTWKNNQKLLCPQCKIWLGVAAFYPKEHRKSFMLFQDSVTKKIASL